jgi:TPR repeat protein
VDEARKQVDERTRDHPTDVPGLGDAAFWIGSPESATLFVFRGGTMRLMIGPSEIGLEKEKELAIRALGGIGNAAVKTATNYGSPRSLPKPVLNSEGPRPSQIEQLKRDLTARADRGDVKAQLALAKLYRFGTLGTDGSAKPDYAGAAYWYQQASDRGEAQAALELALIYRDGLGMPANQSVALDLFRKAADAGYVPAMAPLSFAYAEAKTPVSQERATYWATRAAQAGDPHGWLILGFEYNQGWLGGEPAFAYRAAMDAYKKAADGGICLAMVNIGRLYLHGDGVPQNAALAREWSAKAESCHGTESDWLWDKTASLRAMADGGRLPAAGEVGRTGPAGGSRLSTDEKFLASLGALMAAAIALDVLHPASGSGGGSPAGPDIDLERRWRQDEIDRQNMQRLLAPMPRLRP